jgi:hypothetical protein
MEGLFLVVRLSRLMRSKYKKRSRSSPVCAQVLVPWPLNTRSMPALGKSELRRTEFVFLLAVSCF